MVSGEVKALRPNSDQALSKLPACTCAQGLKSCFGCRPWWRDTQAACRRLQSPVWCVRADGLLSLQGEAL